VDANQHPRIAHPAAPAAWFVAQTEYRAVTIPWTKARATSAPAGLLARGSQLDAYLPRPARLGVRPSGCSSGICPETNASRSPLTVAGTAADLDGPGSHRLHPHRIPEL